MELKEIRKAAKVKVQDIKLDQRTIQKIEKGSINISVQALTIYLDSIGMKLTYSIQ